MLQEKNRDKAQKVQPQRVSLALRKLDENYLKPYDEFFESYNTLLDQN